MIYAMDIIYGGPVGCCQFPDACDMMTEEDCLNAGGVWYPDLQCIGDECTLPVDTVCHMQWDNGSASWYSSGFEVGDQQGNYFNPEALCPDCGPEVYPFLVTQVSGLFYDFAGMGSVDVIVHLYAVEPDSCAGPGADIYSFATTITDFYPTEAVVPMPEVVCVNEDFIVAFEYTAGSVGTIPCVLWTSESMADCISWLWYNVYSPPWQDVKYFWAGVGYHMIRADGICNSGACAGGVPCDLVQDQGAAASYFGSFAAGDAIAKYFDPSVYCEEPCIRIRSTTWNSCSTISLELERLTSSSTCTRCVMIAAMVRGLRYTSPTPSPSPPSIPTGYTLPAGAGMRMGAFLPQHRVCQRSDRIDTQLPV
jgi:hypothetical protein